MAIIAVLSALSAACTPEPELTVVVSLRRSAAYPVLSTFAKETGARLDLRFIDRDEAVGDEYDVLWAADPDVTFAEAAKDRLTRLPATALHSRPPQLVDPDGLWAAVTADVRVIAYDPERIDENRVPTHFEELLDPRIAPQVTMAATTSRSASWHMATVFASKGSQPATAFFHDLKRAGAVFVDGEREVLNAVAGAGNPIGVLDGEVAFSGRELGRRLGILIPDQDSAGAVLRPTTVSIHKDATPMPRAEALAEYLLSAPVGRRLALLSSHLALLADDEPIAGALALRDIKVALPAPGEIARQLSAVHRALDDLR